MALNDDPVQQLLDVLARRRLEHAEANRHDFVPRISLRSGCDVCGHDRHHPYHA